MQARRDEVLNKLGKEFAKLVDYKGKPAKDFIQTYKTDHFSWQSLNGTSSMDNSVELHVAIYYHSEHKITETYSIKVPGVIISADRQYAMRTDGIVVDAFLGQGECLDAYSVGLQKEAVRERSIENDRKQKEIQLREKEIALKEKEIMRQESLAKSASDQLLRANKIFEYAISILQTKDDAQAEIFKKIVPHINGGAGNGALPEGSSDAAHPDHGGHGS